MSFELNPSVQILIPTYNRARYLHRAIGSCLSQTYDNLQILISDNASHDDTEDICLAYAKSFPTKIVYYKNSENIGMTPNWVKLLYEYSSSDFCLLLSDDDQLIDAKFISRGVDELVKKREEGHPVSLVFGDTLLIDESSSLKSKSNIISHDWPSVFGVQSLICNWRRGSKSSFGNHIILSGALFNRELAIKVNAFRSGLLSADFELWWSLLTIPTSACYLNIVASSYSKHDNNEATRNAYDFADWINNFNCYLTPYYSLPAKIQLRCYGDLVRILTLSLIDFCGKELKLFGVNSFLNRTAKINPKLARIFSQIIYSYRLVFLLPFLIVRPFKHFIIKFKP